jgi:hypothetical protein
MEATDTFFVLFVVLTSEIAFTNHPTFNSGTWGVRCGKQCAAISRGPFPSTRKETWPSPLPKT